MRGSEPPEKRRPEASVVWFFDGVVFADEADPGTGMRLSPGLRVTLKDMSLAKLHCGHPVVHLLLGLCQTSEVHARYLDPEPSDQSQVTGEIRLDLYLLEIVLGYFRQRLRKAYLESLV